MTFTVPYLRIVSIFAGLFTCCSAFADLGSTAEQLKARYRDHLLPPLFMKECGVKVRRDNCVFTRPPVISADFRLVEDQVVYVQYATSNEELPLDYAFELLQNNSQGMLWQKTFDESGGGVRVLSFLRSDGAKADLLLSAVKASVTINSPKWIATKAAYHALPWYKKFF